MRRLIGLIFLALISSLIAFPSIQADVDDFLTYPFGTLYRNDFHTGQENFNLREPVDFDSSWVSFSGNWPFGYSYSLSACETGNLVFTGSGGGVLITDVSDPNDLQVISEIRARSLVDASFYEESTQRLYLAAYFSGLEIWDLSDLANPAFLGRCPTEPYPRAGIHVSGDYAFAATVANGLRVIDVSNPLMPFEAAYCAIGNSVWYMAVSGDYLFLSDTTAGMKVVDISNPLVPAIVASYPAAKGDIYISGNHAYIAQNGFGLRIYDITDPLNAFEVGTCSLTDYPREVAVLGDYAFVAGNVCGLVAINVTVPANPFIVGSQSDYFQHIAVCNGYVFVTSEMDGFFAFDVSDPTTMQITGNYGLAGFTSDLAVSGNYLYTGSNGFRVLDISSPANPVQIGYADLPGGCVAVGNTHVIYSPKSMGGNNPVNIMNVDDPSNPYREGYYTCPAMTYDLAVKDNLAFVACWWDGMRIIDFSNPAAPVMVGHVLGWTSGAVPGVEYCFVQAVAVQDDYAYILDYGPFPDDDTFGLYIVDISIPNIPQVINRYTNFVSRGYDLDVQGNYAYIADSNGGMEVIDISDPAAPETVYYGILNDTAQGIKADGMFVYVANYIYGGVQVFFVANPAAPALIGYYQRSGCFAMRVDSQDQYIYVADGVSGIQIYQNLLIQVGTDDNKIKPQKHKVWNYPNPFNPDTTIVFSIKENEEGILTIYNLRGQRILKESFAAGYHQYRWQAAGLASGIYFCKLSSPTVNITRKMILLR